MQRARTYMMETLSTLVFFVCVHHTRVRVCVCVCVCVCLCVEDNRKNVCMCMCEFQWMKGTEKREREN